MNKTIMLMKLLLKDLLSQKRNRLIMFAIGFGAFFIVVGGGYNKGIKQQLLQLMHDGYTGDVTIVSSSVKLEPNPMPIQVGWQDMLIGNQAVLEHLKKDSKVKDILGRLVIYGNVMGEDDIKNEYATIIGCDFKTEKNYTFQKILKFEDNFKLGPNYILISKKIAQKLNLKFGDDIYIFLVDMNETITPVKFKVGGIFTGKGFPAVVEGLIYIDYADLKTALRLTDTYFSSISILFNNQPDFKSTLNRVQTMIPREWSLVTPDISGSFFKGIHSMINLTTKVSNVLMYLIIFLFVYSTLLININSRRREMGIMSSLGISNSQIFMIFTGEGILLGLYPALIGTVLGLLVVVIFMFVGIPAVNDAMKYMFASDVLYFKIDIVAVINATIVISLIAFLGSILPTLKILKLKPVNALKEN